MSSDPNVSPILPVNQAAVRLIQQQAIEANVQMVESEESLNDVVDSSLFNPMAQMQRFRKLEDLRSQQGEKKGLVEEAEEPKIIDASSIEAAADQLQKDNYEFNARTLLILRARITANDTPEEVLDKVLSVYADPSLADEALDFLIETTDANVSAVVKRAKEQLNAERGREIVAGRNMGIQAREFAKEGLGSPTSLRDMYRDITGNPREPLQLFDELTDKFPFRKLKPAILFLLHSLGSDLKSKGSSIPRGELSRLISETRSLQGILGVFRFFQSRMQLIARQFSFHHLELPQRLSFEVLAKLFIKMLAERYMNPERILQSAKAMGISEEVAAQIIIYTQMRDALRQVAPRYYRNPQHRDELLKSFIDAIDKLEDDLEEEEEEERKKKKKEKGP